MRKSGSPARGLWRGALLAAALLIPGSRGEAASSCYLVGVTGISFGAYDPLESRGVTQVGTLTIRCSQTGTASAPPVSVELSAGNSGSFGTRHLRKGNHALRYNLYLNAASTQVWGNGAGGSARFTLLPSGNGDIPLTIYGRILPGQNAESGPYTDTISVTLNF